MGNTIAKTKKWKEDKPNPFPQIKEFESCHDIQDWMSSKEYNELNFQRESLVINPPKACQPLGALFAASGFEGTLPFVHGSQGCTAYFRNNLSRHYREPFSAVSTSMTEDAAVFGGLTNMVQGLENAYKLYKPRMIAICTSCMAEVIGDDLNAFIGEARIKEVIPEDLPTPYANTPSFVGSHTKGYDSMLKSILACLTEGKKGKSNGKINIIPGFDPHIANIREIKRILDLMGVKYTVLADNSDVLDSPQTGEFKMYPGGTKLEDVADSINAIATVTLQKFSTLQTLKFIQEKFEQIGILQYPPMSIKATDQLLMEISRLTEKAIPDELKEERGRVVDAATDAHQYIHGKKYAIFGDPDEVYGIVRFLLEMGGEPIHILTATSSKTFEKEIKQLLESSPFAANSKLYLKKDLWHLRTLVLTDPVDMVIGDSHGKFLAREAGIPLVRVGYPIFDRVNLHRYPVIGYQGTLNLITWIANAFIDHLDRTCDDGHFELLR